MKAIKKEDNEQIKIRHTVNLPVLALQVKMFSVDTRITNFRLQNASRKMCRKKKRRYFYFCAIMRCHQSAHTKFMICNQLLRPLLEFFIF